jgi:hypothetical protein
VALTADKQLMPCAGFLPSAPPSPEAYFSLEHLTDEVATIDAADIVWLDMASSK